MFVSAISYNSGISYYSGISNYSGVSNYGSNYRRISSNSSRVSSVGSGVVASYECAYSDSEYE